VEFSWIIYSLAQWLHTLLNKRGDFDDPFGFLHEYWWCSSSWVSNACIGVYFLEGWQGHDF
jgi:hypothetical protein